MRCPLNRTAIGTLLLALSLAASSANGATITVDTLADEFNTDGDCSLREAMQAANTNAPVDACSAGTAGSDTIVLPAGILPLSVTLTVSEAVTIRGAGRANTTVQRGAATAFNGPGVAGATLTIEDLALIGDINTGGIQDIVVARADFSGVVGTIVNSLNGTIALTDATLTGAGVNSLGGAISLLRTTITGGDINSSSGNVTLIDSAVRFGPSNGVNTSSGAIGLTRSLVAGSSNSGVNSSSGAITIVNSTITGNDQGISAGSSTITLDGATVAFNATDGIAASNVTMTHTIVASNSPDCDTPVNAAQFSLDSDGSCGLAGSGNLSATNPLLGTLANNGGPTLTHMLQSGSPAIDAGSNGLCQAVDQRGVTRPIDGNADAIAICDIGAVEADGGGPPPPPPPAGSTQPVPVLDEWSLLALVGLLAIVAASARRRAGVPRR